MSSLAPVKKEDPGASRNHPQYSLLNISQRDNNVILAKIPDFFANDWRQIQNPTQIGEATMYPPRNGVPDIKFHFYESAVKSFPYEMLPENFEIQFDTRIEPNRYIFKHEKNTGNVKLLGRVNAEANMKGDAVMLSSIRSYILKQENKKKKRDVFGANPEVLPEPQPDESEPAISLVARKKQVKDKRLKKSEPQVRRELLALFRENPNWKLKDIVARIDQDQSYIRSILPSIAEFHPDTKTYVLQEEYK